ncbi:MAG: dihydrolipoyl dehydrogenase [Velocimicrobium sp.]
MRDEYELIIIGAGPGGYVAAVKASKLGLKTAVIENQELGGTCLNRGCIPTKALLHAAKRYREVQLGEQFGIIAKEVSFDYSKVTSYKNETKESLRAGVAQLLKTNKVEVIKGKGTLLKDGSVQVKSQEGEEIYRGKNVLLATGSKAVLPSIEGANLAGIMTSDEMLDFDHIPEHLLIIGGGVIGVEFATVFSSFGSHVTIFEAAERILPTLDLDISRNTAILLKKRGVSLHTKAFIQKIEKERDEFVCTYEEDGKDGGWQKTIKSTSVLFAVGRRANTEGLFDEGVELEMSRGNIAVKENFETSMAHVYAIGDVIGGMQLAHNASSQGIYVAECISGETPFVDLSVVPSCVYFDPEVASVGMTQEEAKKKGIDVVLGKFVTHANGKSIITKEDRGFVKIVAEKETKILLGAQFMCANATDMIGEMGTAISNKMTVQQLRKSMRAHPTYNESIGEALEDCLEKSIHR